MRPIKPLALAFSLLAFAAAQVFAQSSSSSGASPSMSKPSSSSSGSSATGATPSAAGGASSAKAGKDEFDEMDTNHDGQVSRAEWDAHQKKEHGASGSSSGMSSTPS